MATLFRKEELVTAFDIEGSLVKLAQIKIIDNHRLLHRLAVVKAKSSNPADLAMAIHTLAQHFKLSKSLVLLNIPRHMVTVREIEIPSIAPDELAGMVELQSAKFLPYPKEEIVYGYKVMETTKAGYSRIMLVLTHRDVITKLLQGFTKNGIDIHRITLSSEALSAWYLARQTAQQKMTPVVLIDINSSSADIQIFSNGRVEFTRAITFSPEDKSTHLVDEIRRSFLTYKKELKPDVSKMVLTGAESIINQEAPLLKKEFDLPTVYINSLKAWPLAKNNKIPAKEDRSKISFTALLASVFNFDRLDINLLPAKIQKARMAKLVKETLLLTTLLAVCVLLGIGGLVWKKIVDKNDYLRNINSQIQQTDPEVKELTHMITNINIIKKQLTMKGACVDIIRELYRLLPSNISLTILDFEVGDSCTLRGTADELSNVFKFITILEDSDYFENVKVRYATKRAVKKQMLSDFEIVCRLSDVTNIKEVE